MLRASSSLSAWASCADIPEEFGQYLGRERPFGCQHVVDRSRQDRLLARRIGIEKLEIVGRRRDAALRHQGERRLCHRLFTHALLHGQYSHRKRLLARIIDPTHRVRKKLLNTLIEAEPSCCSTWQKRGRRNRLAR